MSNARQVISIRVYSEDEIRSGALPVPVDGWTYAWITPTHSPHRAYLCEVYHIVSVAGTPLYQWDLDDVVESREQGLALPDPVVVGISNYETDGYGWVVCDNLTPSELKMAISLRDDPWPGDDDDDLESAQS